MLSSRQQILVWCVAVWLAVNLVIWTPLRGIVGSWTSVDLKNIVSAGKVSSSSSDSSDSTTTGDLLYPQFMLFGDSITERGYTELMGRLSKYYTRRMDVVNRGFGGYTSADGLRVLPSFFPAALPSPWSLTPQVRVMTVFFGANDASLPGVDSNIPLDAYEDNLRRIADYDGIRLHSTKVIFISPPPVDEHRLWNGNLSHTAELTAEYAEACCRVAAELNRPCLDLWRVMMTKAGWKGKGHNDERLPGSLGREPSDVLRELFVDGLHLSAEGYKLLFRELKALIESDLPREASEAQPFVHPMPPGLAAFLADHPSNDEEDDS